MAFVKRTWMARIGTGLNKFIIGEKDANDKQTLVNSPDSVTQQGDVISADNLNDLEDRIEDGFDGKQDVLTFDDVPTAGSNNPVKSGGVYDAIPNFYFHEEQISLEEQTTSTGLKIVSVTIPSVAGYTCVGIMGWVLTLETVPPSGYNWYCPLGAVRLNDTTINVYINALQNVGYFFGTLRTTLCYRKNS